MNTDVALWGAPPAAAVAWFETVEATLTRFDPESPLSQVNHWPGRWVVVPPLLFRAVQGAIRAAEATGGAFDPTVLDALEAAGYRRSFDLGPEAPAAPVPAGRWREIRLEPCWPAIWLPVGVRLDLGGIGKGLAVDGALSLLKAAPRALVNAGGDVAVRLAPGDAPVAVQVEDPSDPSRVLLTVHVRNGAVATSSTLGRRWGAGLHHIIDPRTGRPADSGLVAATVLAPSAARAEVLAKAALVLGPVQGAALLARRRCQGILVHENGDITTTPGLEGLTHGAA